MSERVKRSGQLRTIEELCDFSNGYGFGPTTWSQSGLPIIRIQNLNGSREFNHFGGEPEPDWIIEPGTLLFAWAGTKGVSFGPTIWNGPRGVLNQHIYKVHPKNGVDKRWLFNSLKVVTERIERKAHGFKSTLLHVGKSDITGQQVLTPPLPEQQKIADILGTWDEALEKLDALIAAKARRKQALMRQLLTGHRRLPGFSKPWKRVELSDVAEECSIRNGQKLDRSRLYAVTKAEGMVPMRENVQGATINRCQIVERGWFAYNPMRINIGSIARWEHSDPVMVSPDYVVFRTKESLLLSDYLNHIRRAALWSDFVGAAGNGSVRIRIWFDDLGYFEFPLPPVDEQRAIAAVLDTADAELRLLRQQRAALDRQKRGLMQQLLTGRIRVAAK